VPLPCAASESTCPANPMCLSCRKNGSSPSHQRKPSVKNPYNKGLAFLAKAGKLQPTSDRVFLRAIWAMDDGAFVAVRKDHKQAVAFEIVAVGPAVKEPGIKPGRYCFHISAAHDAIDYDRDDCEYISVREDHIPGTWSHEDAIALRMDENAATDGITADDRARRLMALTGA